MFDNVLVFDNIWVCSKKDFVWFLNVGIEYGMLIVFKMKEGKLFVLCGCFKGMVDKFFEKFVEVYDE